MVALCDERRIDSFGGTCDIHSIVALPPGEGSPRLLVGLLFFYGIQEDVVRLECRSRRGIVWASMCELVLDPFAETQGSHGPIRNAVRTIGFEFHGRRGIWMEISYR